VRLLKVAEEDEPPKESRPLDVTHSVDLPDDDTTYWCSVHRLPDAILRRKHHVVRYEPVSSASVEDMLHHMEVSIDDPQFIHIKFRKMYVLKVFHCDGEPGERFPLWSGPCGDDGAPQQLTKCKKVLAAWAIGAGPFDYPDEAGLAVGGPNFNPYIMLEVHYNNEHKLSGKYSIFFTLLYNGNTMNC